MKTSSEISIQCEEALSTFLGLSMHFLKILRFNRKNPQQLFAVCMYARILELAITCKALLEKNLLIGIPVLLRSMFEADVHLTNLINYPEHYKSMYASFLKEKLRYTKEGALKKPNPFLVALRENINSVDAITEIENELSKLAKEGHKPTSIKYNAKLAGKLDEYLTVYNQLCLDTHNNIKSLEDWHIEATKTDNYQVALFKKEKDDLLHFLCAIPGLLLHKTKCLSDFLEMNEIDFGRYFNELYILQETLKKFYNTGLG